MVCVGVLVLGWGGDGSITSNRSQPALPSGHRGDWWLNSDTNITIRTHSSLTEIPNDLPLVCVACSIVTNIPPHGSS